MFQKQKINREALDGLSFGKLTKILLLLSALSLNLALGNENIGAQDRILQQGGAAARPVAAGKADYKQPDTTKTPTPIQQSDLPKSESELVKQQTAKFISSMLPPQNVPTQYEAVYRWQAHIFTDKVVYRPNDVIFMELLVVDPFTKTPVGWNQTYQYSYSVSMEIENPAGTVIYSSYGYVQNTTATFTYKVPKDVVGGEYKIRMSNYNYLAKVTKLIRIRDYPRDQLNIKVNIPFESYRPGDTVNGQIQVESPDGQPFESQPQFEFSANFDSLDNSSNVVTSTIEGKNISLSLLGEGFFSFKIPANTTSFLSSIGFLVTYEETQQSYSYPLVITQNDMMIIDFYTENFGPLVTNVTNKIYFQAWATKEREDVYDFNNSNLIAIKEDYTTTKVLDSRIRTEHRGKGSFEFFKSHEYKELYLELPVVLESGQTILIKRALSIRGFTNLYPVTTFRANDTYKPIYNQNSNSEVYMSILNKNRLVSGTFQPDTGAAWVRFDTNELVNETDKYLLQLKTKEQVMSTIQLQFNKSMTNYTQFIKPDGVFYENGGVLTVNLYKMSESLVVYFKENGTSTDAFSKIDQEMVSRWLEPKGEIILFMKPRNVIDIEVITDKQTYAPGDVVNYEIILTDRRMKKIINDKEVFVSLTVTDESVFSKVENRKQPPSLGASIFLEKEVNKNSGEWYYSNQYVDHYFQNASTVDKDSNDRNLELLLGVQGWRANVFDLAKVSYLYNNVDSLSDNEKEAFQQLSAYLYRTRYYYYSNTTAAGGPMMAENAVQKNRDVNMAKPAAAPAPAPPPAPQFAPKMPMNNVQGGQNTDVIEEAAPNDFMVDIPQNTRHWAHPLRKNFNPAERVDLTETVLFSSSNRIRSGSLKGQFRLSDLITKFRITVNAIDTRGTIGYKKASFQSNKSLYINFDVPSTMTVSDKIKIDLKIGNLNPYSLNVRITTDSPTKGPITYTLPAGTFTVRSRTSVTKTITLTAVNITTDTTFVTIGINATANGVKFADSLTMPVKVLPRGFPRQVSNGGSIGSQIFTNDTPTSANFDVVIPKSIEPGSALFTAKIFSSNFASLLEAIQALIQDPYGCFEQTSATTYPMVMALQFLKAQPTTDTKVQGMILSIEEKLKKGYDKLVSYKTKEKGYEWFGESPAHESLSAYGLMQFTEMAKVTSFVDDGMVKDLKGWLMSRRDGKGLFLKNEKALDSFGRAPDNITAAYIVWTLTSSGETAVDTEIKNLKQLADDSIANGRTDAYFLGLVAASLYNLKRVDEARVYADAIVKHQLPTGNVTQSLTSITTSMGENLVIETTSVAAIAWLSDQQRFGNFIPSAINWIVAQVKSGGRYGSTQATILALKAITTYMENFASLNGNGAFTLRLNKVVAQQIFFTSERREAIVFDFAALMADSRFKAFFNPGSTLNIDIALENFVPNRGENKDFRVNYAFDFKYYDVTPESANSVLNFTVQQSFDTSTLGSASRQGKVFSYKLRLENKNRFTPGPTPLPVVLQEKNDTAVAQDQKAMIWDGGLGMVVSVVRVPSCLQIDFNYLEAMKRNKLVDFYEIRNFNSEIVLYWRQMRGGEVKTVQVDLIQRYAGGCLQKPHTAYPYYNNDQPIWVLATAAKKE